MSAAYTDGSTVTQLDGKAAPDLVVTAEDVKDSEKLARMLQGALKDLAELKRRWNPRVMYFRDLAVTATTTTIIRLEHGFGGRVNWEIVRWDANVAATAPRIDEDSSTDANALCLVSGVAGTVTIRVEAAG